MNDHDDRLSRLDHLEAITLSLRDQLATQHEMLDTLSTHVARLERSMAVSSSELLAALVDLRAHLVDLTLDGYYPTRLPPKPFGTVPAFSVAPAPPRDLSQQGSAADGKATSP